MKCKNKCTMLNNEAAALYKYLLINFSRLSRDKQSCGLFLKVIDVEEFKVLVVNDFKAVSTFLKTIKTINKSGTIDNPNFCIYVKIFLQDETYIIINVIENSHIKFSDGQVYGTCVYQYKCKSLMFFSTKKIYFKSKYSKYGEFTSSRENRWIPANLKTLWYLPDVLKNFIMTYLAQKNQIWKDFLPYTLHLPPPVSIELINDSYTLKDLLEKKFKIYLPRSVNKKPFAVMYAACCSVKYVEENQKGLLFSSEITTMKMSRTQKEMAADYISNVICKRLSVSGDTDDNFKSVLCDYIDMAMGREKINLLLGKKTYRKKHDELVVKYRLKSKVKIVIPNTPLSMIKLSKDFIRITTNKQLVEESVKNNNCVWKYAEKINKGKYLIYSLDYNGEHCTIEIAYYRKKYHILQLSKRFNEKVLDKTREYVQNAIDLANL